MPVLGTAVAARAAVALTETAGIPATSVARLLATDQRARRAGLSGVLPAGAVLVVDEAGMLGTRQLARLLEATSRAGEESRCSSGTTASCPNWPPAAPSTPWPATCPPSP